MVVWVSEHKLKEFGCSHARVQHVLRGNGLIQHALDPVMFRLLTVHVNRFQISCSLLFLNAERLQIK